MMPQRFLNVASIRLTSFYFLRCDFKSEGYNSRSAGEWTGDKIRICIKQEEQGFKTSTGSLRQRDSTTQAKEVKKEEWTASYDACFVMMNF